MAGFQSQSLLHQGIGRTALAPHRSISSNVSVPSSSGHRADLGRWLKGGICVSQSLLHQGIGRTYEGERCKPRPGVSVPSSSGHRADSRLRKLGTHHLVSVPSSSGHRADGLGVEEKSVPGVSVPSSSGHRADPLEIMLSNAVSVSVPSSSGHRADPRVVRTGHERLSQSLLHQGIGRTEAGLCAGAVVGSQSLLHQGIGRTRDEKSLTESGRVSVPSSSGHRADRSCPAGSESHSGLSPFFIRASGGPYWRYLAGG